MRVDWVGLVSGWEHFNLVIVQNGPESMGYKWEIWSKNTKILCSVQNYEHFEAAKADCVQEFEENFALKSPKSLRDAIAAIFCVREWHEMGMYLIAYPAKHKHGFYPQEVFKLILIPGFHSIFCEDTRRIAVQFTW